MRLKERTHMFENIDLLNKHMQKFRIDISSSSCQTFTEIELMEHQWYHQVCDGSTLLLLICRLDLHFDVISILYFVYSIFCAKIVFKYYVPPLRYYSALNWVPELSVPDIRYFLTTIAWLIETRQFVSITFLKLRYSNPRVIIMTLGLERSLYLLMISPLTSTEIKAGVLHFHANSLLVSFAGYKFLKLGGD